MTTIRRVLFLCTGNYYRSRYAEELFNHIARAEGLGWRAFSCGAADQAFPRECGSDVGIRSRSSRRKRHRT
jgi:protein-tyrosine phosphatase